MLKSYSLTLRDFMRRKRKILQELSIEAFASEGKSIGYFDGKVVFVSNAIPGDIVDVKIIKSKDSYMEGKIIRYIKNSDDRVKAFCKHYGKCGGCKWQDLPYEKQTQLKHQQVVDQLERIAKVDYDRVKNILPSPQTTEYRNKLEYTFGIYRWMTKEEIDSGLKLNKNGLGFHIPGRFDRIVHIDECHLQNKLTNQIRNSVYEFAVENEYSFYDIKSHTGFLRNLITRNNSLNEWMVIVQVGKNEEANTAKLLDMLVDKFPQIVSLYYVINTKKNETFHDLELHLWHGNPYLTEKLGDLSFNIGPKSFFQTNVQQTKNLYDLVKEMSQLKASDILYDLYTGTGTIALYLAKNVQKVIGIETVPEAIDDARKNAELNNIDNATFYSGDVRVILDEEFIVKNGKPDTIIVDPPRAGLNKDVIDVIKSSGANKIVYVSCNPATQARDLQLFDDTYKIEQVQPLDMFPHTHHVENIVRLKRRII